MNTLEEQRLHTSGGSHPLLDDKLLLINLIERLITSILEETKNLTPLPTPFNCKSPPRISVGEYLKRTSSHKKGIAKYSHCSTAAYVISLIYIDRLQERIPDFVVNQYNIHRLVITSLMIAVKYIDDFYYKNEYYAKIGGITKEEIDSLEIEMMSNFNFTVFITQNEFINYLEKLQLYQNINYFQG